MTIEGPNTPPEPPLPIVSPVVQDLAQGDRQQDIQAVTVPSGSSADCSDIVAERQYTLARRLFRPKAKYRPNPTAPVKNAPMAGLTCGRIGKRWNRWVSP